MTTRKKEPELSKLWTIMSADEFIALGPVGRQVIQPRELSGLDWPAVPLCTRSELGELYAMAKQCGLRLGREPVRFQVEVDDSRTNVHAMAGLHRESLLDGMVVAYARPIPRSQWVKAVLGPDGDDDPRFTMVFRGEPQIA